MVALTGRLVYVWRAECKPEAQAAFEELNKREWEKLFKGSRHYSGTRIFKSERDYLLMNVWEYDGAFPKFLKEHKGEYEQLGSKTLAMASLEEKLGVFTPAGAYVIGGGHNIAIQMLLIETKSQLSIQLDQRFRVFRDAANFFGTELLKSVSKPARFLVMNRWSLENSSSIIPNDYLEAIKGFGNPQELGLYTRL